VNNLYPIHDSLVSRQEKEKLLSQQGMVFWFTGLSGSGKSTIATAFQRTLYEQGYFAEVLDGDNIRTGLNNNLSFSEADRAENIRRIAEVAKLFCQNGIITICSFISPTIAMREQARTIIGPGDFVEVFVDTPLEICEQRDVKGLYARARRGEIKGFTGIDSPFEAPINPEIHINTTTVGVKEAVGNLMAKVRSTGYEVRGMGYEVRGMGYEMHSEELTEDEENIASDFYAPYNKKSVQNLIVWQKAMQITSRLLKMVEEIKEFGLRDQIIRSSVSIASNISEGYNRGSNKEFIRYLFIAKGSASELHTQLLLVKELYTFNDLDAILNDLSVLLQQLGKLIQYRKSHGF